MKLYGEAIYGTRPFVTFGEGTTELKRDPEDAWNEYGAIKSGLNRLNFKDIRFTTKDNIVYAIQLGWNSTENELLLKTFSNEAKDIEMKEVAVLGSNEKISWKRTNEGLKLRQPKNKPKEADTALIYKIELE